MTAVSTSPSQSVQTPIAPAELTVSISYIDGKKKRCSIVSIISIRLFDMLVATASFGGKYTKEQALQEWKRHPERFNPGPAAAAALLL